MSIPVPDQFALGNIVKSSKIRGYLYDAGIAVGLGITALNAGYAYLVAQNAAEFPLWLGAAAAVYVVVAPGLFGVAKANVTPNYPIAAIESAGAD